MAEPFGKNGPRNGKDPVLQRPFMKVRVKKQKKYSPWSYDAQPIRGILAREERAEYEHSLEGYEEMNAFGKAFMNKTIEDAKKKALANGGNVILRKRSK